MVWWVMSDWVKQKCRLVPVFSQPPYPGRHPHVLGGWDVGPSSWFQALPAADSAPVRNRIHVPGRGLGGDSLTVREVGLRRGGRVSLWTNSCT